MIKLRFSSRYQKMLLELGSGGHELRLLIREKTKLFVKNPNDTRLENHVLKKKMKGKWAFSITNNVRIVYEWLGKNAVRFLAIGPHKKVYNRNN